MERYQCYIIDGILNVQIFATIYFCELKKFAFRGNLFSRLKAFDQMDLK